MKYTEKIHAKNLIEFLENYTTIIEQTCPARLYKGYTNSSCPICLAFVSVEDPRTCPCDYLTCEEAVKRSWIALEEKGYLD